MHAGDGHPVAVDRDLLQWFEVEGTVELHSSERGVKLRPGEPVGRCRSFAQGQDEPADAASGEVWVGVESWSPDDRYVLTKSGHTDSAGWDVFRIRRARDGALVTTFQGSNNLYRNSSWERPSTFVFYAGYDCSDGDCPSIVVVRCTVHGACEQGAPPAGVILAQERQVPPS